MANFCSKCGEKLGIIIKLRGGDICEKCIKEILELREQAKIRYPSILSDIYKGKMKPEEGKKILEGISQQARLKDQDEQAFNATAVSY